MSKQRIPNMFFAALGAAASAATGCELILGGVDRDLIGGGGGEASTSSSSSSSGIGGQPECEVPGDCAGQDTACLQRTCTQSKCGVQHSAKGKPCSEMGGKLCDGEGNCVQCLQPQDCPSGVCKNNKCQDPACTDKVQNGDETDVDCGGPGCDPCDDGKVCLEPGDCESQFCEPQGAGGSGGAGGAAGAAGAGGGAPAEPGVCAACESDVDCLAAGDLYCDAGKCTDRKKDGEACGDAGECKSGFCVDAVCCESGCDAVCMSCIKANTGEDDGKCAAVKVDTDPDKECEDQAEATCGAAKDKACNGDAKAPGCVLWDNKTVCIAASCSAGQQTPASLCDGKGACVKAASTACTPYKCTPNGVVCLAECKLGKDADCADGNYCEADKCVAKKDNGKACVDPKECKSGSCLDLFCCDTACAGKCEACGLQGSEGKCSPIAKGQDPADECPGGACNGAGACALDGAQACVTNKDCLSGSRPPQDLVCCDKACSGTCEACLKSKTGGSDGVCGYVLPGQNPDNECKGNEKCWSGGVCLECGKKPLAPGGQPCPKECTGGCDPGMRICKILCDEVAECASKALSCPAGYDCEVQCAGAASCKSATVTCPAGYDCKVTCSGDQACQQTKIACSTLGTCSLVCDKGANHCKDAALSCGTNACTATCNEPNEPKPVVSCGGSCQCTLCQ